VVSLDAQKTIDMTKLVVEDILTAGKIPVALGGEHAVTLGIVKGLGAKAGKTAIVSFDAHLDLRHEYLGTRSVSKEELAYAKKVGVDFFTSQQIIKQGSLSIVEQLREKLKPFDNLYLTVDMDILDPAFAPAVQNPEPDGISTSTLLDLVCSVCDKRVVGFDVVEIVPIYDQGISAIAAAKVVFEMLCQVEKSKS